LLSIARNPSVKFCKKSKKDHITLERGGKSSGKVWEKYVWGGKSRVQVNESMGKVVSKRETTS